MLVIKIIETRGKSCEIFKLVSGCFNGFVWRFRVEC